MKYKIGDKVRYDGGDWWFFGTVSAVFEHSICPCYRLSVERMEKKSCKFSITQFEFELEAYNDEADSDRDERKWENTEKRQMIPLELKQLAASDTEQKSKSIPEPVPEKKQRKKRKPELEKVELIPIQTKEPAKRKTSKVWERNLEQYLKGKKSYAIYNWITNNRKHYKSGTLSEEKYERLKSINFPFEGARKNVVKKRKSSDEWELNFESYLKGEKSDIISSWIANNRREFKTGKLTEAKYKKLVEINFPFDVGQMKDDNWEKLFEEWKQGDRKSVKIQQWRQRSIRQYSEDKLSVDRILKLKEVGILK